VTMSTSNSSQPRADISARDIGRNDVRAAVMVVLADAMRGLLKLQFEE
jgi:hypothetical protein